MTNSVPLAVLGSGSWGTALAIHFARTGKPTRLWGRNAVQQREMQQAGSGRLLITTSARDNRARWTSG